jgi:hypothetical protein
VTSDPLLYRDFYYPLNVFMHVLSHEEGRVDYLHYGLFEGEGESIGEAQERSTALLLERLPPPPARVLDVGIGLATTLTELVRRGYEAEGITPDEKQIAMVRARHGDALPVQLSRFETFETEHRFDAIVFQESSQYIRSEDLFSRAPHLAPRILVLDEFSLGRIDEATALHSFDGFLAAAAANGFRLVENLDLSAQAAPTVRYFMQRIPRYRDQLTEELGITDTQVDELLASGETYLERYRNGVYGYFLLDFRR